jgi:hypothetical protein
MVTTEDNAFGMPKVKFSISAGNTSTIITLVASLFHLNLPKRKAPRPCSDEHLVSRILPTMCKITGIKASCNHTVSEVEEACEQAGTRKCTKEKVDGQSLAGICYNCKQTQKREEERQREQLRRDEESFIDYSGCC